MPQKAKAPPPPPQPTEPQPWSRDLDLESGPTQIDEDQLAEGLVASDSGVLYSSERLTYESAFNDETPKSEAERARERARARAEAAGRPAPPQVASAPVEEVSAQNLPPIGEAAAAESEGTPAPGKRDWRKSRLPPPPKFPPLPPEGAAASQPGEAEVAAEAVEAPEGPEAATKEAPAREAILPETALGPAEPPAGEPAAAEATVVELVAAEQIAAVAPAAEAAAPEEAAAFAAEAWEAPAGTILVQVSAVEKKEHVVEEWQRLRARYPQVLKPLRLVVEEAKLGDRGVFYRVQAGAFGTEEGATAACGSLIDAGQACFVVVR
ncbi:SPOR domain-containing protein [Pelagibius marinus]|uniref:SPOR domain-containing protein n=1 Tax=Pelagibius marinus TaxID=2762760 RepID=UPI001872B87E|nr:SPOR domain-containing protein [Pelagibius marinus]